MEKNNLFIFYNKNVNVKQQKQTIFHAFLISLIENSYLAVMLSIIDFFAVFYFDYRI